jgi:UDP-glucose 4-epimerase
MEQDMKVLIFGISGNSGRELANYYLSKGAEVWGVGRRERLDADTRINYVSMDIQDQDSFQKLPNSFDLVVNFAGVQPSILSTSEKTNLSKTLREYVNVNIVGVYNILEYLSSSDVGTYIYATTHRDYELHWPKTKNLKNNLPPAINYQGDHTMYAISKVAGQMMAEYMAPLHNIRCFTLRLPMIFMVPENPTYLAHGQPTVMPFLKLIHNAMKDEPLEIWGDPKMPRDYVYIDNLLSLIDLCYNSTLSTGVFNVGTGEGATTEYFVRTIGSVFGSTNEFIYRPEKMTFKSAVYNIDEERRLLNYTPIMLKEMLQKMKLKIEEGDYTAKWGWSTCV